MIIFYIFVALLGLVFGSFISMLTYRLPRLVPLKGRSFCDRCKKKIDWYENLPLISFFLLQGKCQKCTKPISIRYPLIETGTALFFVVTSYAWIHLREGYAIAYQIKQLLGLPSLFLFLLMAAFMVALFITDLEFKILPDILVFFLLLITCYLLLILPSPLFFTHLLTGSLVSSFFLFIYLITQGRGMGFGDVKLGFVLGTLLGYPESVVFLFLAFLTGGIVGIILLLMRKARFGAHVPFGPFLLIGAIVSFFFGKSIYVWYMTQLIY